MKALVENAAHIAHLPAPPLAEIALQQPRALRKEPPLAQQRENGEDQRDKNGRRAGNHRANRAQEARHHGGRNAFKPRLPIQSG